MRIKDLMLFGYDFPYKKSQDTVLSLLVENYNIKFYIAAPWKNLNLPKNVVRVRPEHSDLIDPRKLCERFNIDYYVFPHNSRETIRLLKAEKFDLGVVAGSRVLSNEVIEAAGGRILNVHPGYLPLVRGLDTLLWSIYSGWPAGISAHLISEKIDSGLLVYREKLKVYPDDTIIDISLRLVEHQSEVLQKALKLIAERPLKSFKNLDDVRSIYNTAMPEELQPKAIKMFPAWLKKYARHRKPGR